MFMQIQIPPHWGAAFNWQTYSANRWPGHTYRPLIQPPRQSKCFQISEHSFDSYSDSYSDSVRFVTELLCSLQTLERRNATSKLKLINYEETLFLPMFVGLAFSRIQGWKKKYWFLAFTVSDHAFWWPLLKAFRLWVRVGFTQKRHQQIVPNTIKLVGRN